MFAYCNNNAVNYMDTAGTRPLHFPVCVEDEGRRYITNQVAIQYGFQSFGITNIAHGGCGVVASYNALITLGNSKDFEDVLGYFNNHMLLIPGKGMFGLTPSLVRMYFSDLGYHVKLTDSQDLIDLYSKTADASIMYYQFPATYLGIKAYSAHFVSYQWVGNEYIAYNTSENMGVYSFGYPSDYGYKGVRYYAVGIFIYE